jgi:lysyl-tRNA synthetase class 1
MSSSSGVGVSGQEFFASLPSTLVRYFYLRTRPNVAIEVRPMTELVPKLFDDFDRLSQQIDDEAVKVLWSLSTLRPLETVVSRTVRFSTIAQWVQMPNVDILKEAALLLGDNLNEREQEIIESKVYWAKYWLEHYASSEEKFEIQSKLPQVVLTEAQQKYVGLLAEKLAHGESAEDFQQTVYQLAKDMNLSSRDAFAAIYMLFLNRQNGPKAGWLLYSLDREFVLNRLKQGGHLT